MPAANCCPAGRRPPLTDTFSPVDHVVVSPLSPVDSVGLSVRGAVLGSERAPGDAAGSRRETQSACTFLAVPVDGALRGPMRPQGSVMSRLLAPASRSQRQCYRAGVIVR